MAIYCEAISVIVRKETVRAVLNISPDELIRKFPGGSCWQDENLIRFGFMAPQDAGVWKDYLEDMGLRFVEPTENGFNAIDFVVVDQNIGSTCECSWIESEIIDGYRWAWEAGKPRGAFNTPPDLSERKFEFIPNEEVDGLPFVIDNTWGSDQTINQKTGNPTYVGRVYKDLQLYDDLIRRAKDSHNLAKFVEAYEYFRKAESIQTLQEEHRIPAAIASLSMWRHTRDGRFASETLHRWIEVTELGPGDEDSRCWIQRSYIERALRLPRESRNSALRAASLQAKGL
jgi:hypothetical protein